MPKQALGTKNPFLKPPCLKLGEIPSVLAESYGFHD